MILIPVGIILLSDSRICFTANIEHWQYLLAGSQCVGSCLVVPNSESLEAPEHISEIADFE